jgi:hypothetical protein
VSSGVVHAWQVAPNRSWVAGGALVASGGGSVFAAPNGDGRLEVFLTVSGSAGHVWQLAPNGTTGWSQAQILGGTGWVGVGANADGRIEAMAVACGPLSCSVLDFAQTAPNSGWTNRPGWPLPPGA